jgi:hypothetical protein
MVDRRGRKETALDKRAGARAVSLAAFAVMVVILFLAASLLGSGSVNAQFTGPNVITPEPDPWMEGNATISNHLQNYSTLQYPSGASSGVLAARVDPWVVNPLTITPNDIVAPGILQAQKIGGVYWNSTTTVNYGATTAGWNVGYSALDGATETGPTVTTANSEPAVSFSWNFSSHEATPYEAVGFQVSQAQYASSNLQFNYATFGVSISGPSLSTTLLEPSFQNISGGAQKVQTEFGTLLSTGLPSRLGTTSGTTFSASLAAGTASLYFSVPLSAITSTTENLNLSVATGFNFGFIMDGKASTTSTTYTATVTQVALTTGPFNLGTTEWGPLATEKPTQCVLYFGAANITALVPSFSYTSIASGGFTVAIVQSANDLPAADVVTTANAVSVANATSGGPGYVEQVTYNYAYGLPTASGVSYGAFKFVDEPEVTGAQYAVVTVGGTGYTTTYQAYSAGTVHTVISSVSPTTTTYWVGVVYFTGPQWDLIATAPGIFSAGGIEYWWFILVGAIIAIAGGSSAWVTSNERSLKVRRGVGRVLFGLGDRRPIRKDRRGTMEARHAAAISLGLIFVAAGGIGLWAYLDGADYQGITGAFLAGLILLLALAAIIFVVYEVVHHIRHRSHSG